ncbi:hypothetical protein [Amycolatopsis sp.]|uniref:hypothetical protein n=1 Tax=Amycolatopsis sp. TaxID=37632 RepID=UPI002E0B1A85|nr:hypothetical protein [Amycolatopsis sp.]
MAEVVSCALPSPLDAATPCRVQHQPADAEPVGDQRRREVVSGWPPQAARDRTAIAAAAYLNRNSEVVVMPGKTGERAGKLTGRVLNLLRAWLV